MAKVYLLDTMNFIFRAYFALPKYLSNAAGKKTGAVLGVYNALKHLVRTREVTHCLAALESREPNFREALDESYKANRPPAPPELKEQIPVVIEMCEHLGIRTLGISGYEADDILASVAKRLSADGHEAIIVSNDKDLAQTVRFPGVSLLHTLKKGEFQELDTPTVKTLYGVTPEQIPAWLALMGDQADNIQGVKGIGEKTAAKLLVEHSLDELLSDAQAGGRWGERLLENREQVLHNLKLTEICCEVPLPEYCNIDDLALQPLDLERARQFFVEQEMHKSVSDFDGLLPAQPTVAALWY